MAGKRRQYPDGAKLCTHCKARKPLDCFYKHRGQPASWCKVCVRIGISLQQKTPQAAVVRAAYRSRTEVRERLRERDRRRRPRGVPRRENRTARGRLLHSRRQARIRLRRAITRKRRRELERLIAAYSAEIQRMDGESERLEPVERTV